jgi:hypothetical protein
MMRDDPYHAPDIRKAIFLHQINGYVKDIDTNRIRPPIAIGHTIRHTMGETAESYARLLSCGIYSLPHRLERRSMQIIQATAAGPAAAPAEKNGHGHAGAVRRPPSAI